ncbi:MAG: hypothetical protein ACI841_000949 [Planctomycetota bacterium]|jgi:hypothetical protein
MAASEFEAYMERLIEALRAPVSDEGLRLALDKAYGSPIFKAPAFDDLRDVNRAMRAAACALNEFQDPFNASRLAYVIGVFIEQGADADHVSRELTTCLASALQHLRELQEAVGGTVDEPLAHLQEHADGVRALLGLKDLSLAVMTVLCRAKKSRIEVRTWSNFRRDLEELSFPNAGYLRGLLGCVDDLELTVIHVHQMRGYRVTAQAVRNNFHLFSLLQAELIGNPLDGRLEGPTLDPAMIAYMRGETHQRPSDSDWAVWHFGTYRSWTKGGFLADIQLTNIWGEMSPADIPMLDGQRFVLLGPSPLRSKSWDANFIASLHDAHEPRLSSHQLTKREVQECLDRIVAAQ